MSITVNVFSPWGRTRRLQLSINPNIPVEQFKQTLREELQIDAKDIKIELENNESFGETLEKGSLKGNGCYDGCTITVTSLGVEYGTEVASSVATSKLNANRFDPSHSADAWREHVRGINYEGDCPTNEGRKIILNRGYGTFDWAEDPLGLPCPCCQKIVDPRTIKRVSVNHCEWTWGGIADNGEKLRDKGVTQNTNQWIIDGTRNWRKLFIRGLDPFQPHHKLFTCAFCKEQFLESTAQLIHNRYFCNACSLKLRQALEARKQTKGYKIVQEDGGWGEGRRRKETSEMYGDEVYEDRGRVKLVGMGEQIELRRTLRPKEDV